MDLSSCDSARYFAAAMSDVLAAQTLSDVPQPHRALVCFHCQQAAERMLKGVLASHGSPVPDTFHIGLLLRQVKAQNAQLQELSSDLALLTVYSGENIATLDEEPTQEEMHRALRLVDSLHAAMRKAGYPLPE